MPKLSGVYVGKGVFPNTGKTWDRPNYQRSEYPDGVRWARWHRLASGYWVYYVYRRLA
jgi:hypothetical protein